jgi:hypothetical protein
MFGDRPCVCMKLVTGIGLAVSHFGIRVEARQDAKLSAAKRWSRLAEVPA